MEHSFFCNKSPVHVPTWRMGSGDFVNAQYKIRYKANEMGCGLKLPRTAQAMNISRRSRDLKANGISEVGFTLNRIRRMKEGEQAAHEHLLARRKTCYLPPD